MLSNYTFVSSLLLSIDKGYYWVYIDTSRRGERRKMTKAEHKSRIQNAVAALVAAGWRWEAGNLVQKDKMELVKPSRKASTE